jgi:RNA recognition motif-containing protein
MVQVTQSEKNRIAAAQAAMAAGPTKIYIGGLHPGTCAANCASAHYYCSIAITEDDLRIIVTGIGPVEDINLHRDDAGESKGFCFVQFKKVCSK